MDKKKIGPLRRRYVEISLPDNVERDHVEHFPLPFEEGCYPFTRNIDLLFEFINKYTDHAGSGYGAAYRRIQKEANRIHGYHDLHIYKREVASLHRVYVKNGLQFYKDYPDRERVIKIPYTVIYIIKAMYNIYCQEANYYTIPGKLKELRNEKLGDAFYRKQMELFNEWYDYYINREHLDDVTKAELCRELHRDLFAEKSILNLRFVLKESVD